MRPGARNSALERYLPHATVATTLIAAVPVWLGMLLVDNSWAVTGIAVLMSFALTHVLGLLWQQLPGSEDVVFGDLMLWSYLRRLRTQRGVTKQVERLGLGKADKGEKPLARDQQLRLLKRLAVSLEAGDPYLNGHSQRVARHAFMIAKFMKLPRRERAKIKLAGALHDVGKLYVPQEILNKPDRLTDTEFETVKKHASIGSEIVARLGDDELTAMVRHHHERIDGTGYPDQRRGTDIPLGARILSVADTFDALTSRRAYRPAQKHKLAIGILQKESGHQLDPDAVKAFLRYYTGFRSVGRWFFLTGGFSHAAELAFAWTQRIGLAGIANAAVAGGTAVAIAASPVVSSNVLRRNSDEVHAAKIVAHGEGDHRGGAPKRAAPPDKAGGKGNHKKSAPGRPEKTEKAKRNSKEERAEEDGSAPSGSAKGRDKTKKKDEEVSTDEGDEVDATEETATDPALGEDSASADPGGNGKGRDKKLDDSGDPTSDPDETGPGKGKKDKDL